MGVSENGVPQDRLMINFPTKPQKWSTYKLGQTQMYMESAKHSAGVSASVPCLRLGSRTAEAHWACWHK